MGDFLERGCVSRRCLLLFISFAIAVGCGDGLMGQVPGRPDCSSPGSGGVVGCADGRPCFHSGGQDGNNLVFDFRGGYDFFNVRYKVVSGDEKQETSKDGIWVVYGVKPAAAYTIKVQGCTSHALRSSDCSQWVEMKLYTHPPNAPKCPVRF